MTNQGNVQDSQTQSHLAVQKCRQTSFDVKNPFQDKGVTAAERTALWRRWYLAVLAGLLGALVSSALAVGLVVGLQMRHNRRITRAQTLNAGIAGEAPLPLWFCAIGTLSLMNIYIHRVMVTC